MSLKCAGVEWLILSKQCHNIVAEVGHVLADHKSQVARIVLLIEDDWGADLLISPQSILGIGQLVNVANKHGDRH